MRRSVSLKDISTFAQLDMVYNQVRVIEARQNETQYKCLGSGECCKIGLVLPMLECANIAFNLRQEYYLHLENKGQEYADQWMESVVNDLKEALKDESWIPGGDTERHCAFYKGGCTIYRFRPLVCRSFGTISTVNDFCPRIRNENGSIDYYGGPPVQRVIKDYQNLIKQYAEENSENDLTVYMPLGVLSFLLPVEELKQLKDTTDPKFWNAIMGWFNYRVHFTKEHGYSLDELKEEAAKAGVDLAFKTD